MVTFSKMVNLVICENSNFNNALFTIIESYIYIS